MDERDLLTRILPAGRFALHRRLGEGGFGAVYEGLDLPSDRPVAIKLLSQVSPWTLEQFKREFRTLADVRHSNLVRLYELFSDGEQWCFTMELLRGTTFLRYVRDHPDRLRGALSQLAAGVRALHDARIVHQDLKPSNVMVTTEGRVVLLDFGLARQLRPGADELSTASRICGTPAYVAPEQVLGEDISPAADWYAVGIMLYQALAGLQPFKGSVQEIMIRKTVFTPPPPSSVEPDVPADLDDLCHALMQREVRLRAGHADVVAALGQEAIDTLDPAELPAQGVGEQIVGRAPLLARMAEAIDETDRGRAVELHLRGASGMGKSTVARTFLDSLAGGPREIVVLSGRCYERETVPYKAVDPLVDELVHHLRALSTEEVEGLLPVDVLALARLFPVLQKLSEVASARRRVLDIRDDLELRGRAARALRELLTRLAHRQPLVLAIDDLQWGDAESAVLLSEVMRPPSAPPLLLLSIYRSDHAGPSPLLEEMARQRRDHAGRWNVVELDVGELDPDAALELAAAALAEDHRSFAEAVAGESGGCPIFIMELARHVSQHRALPDGSSDPDGLALDLEDVILERVASLPPAAQAVLQVLAVAAGPLERTACLVAAGLERRNDDAVAQLRELSLLRTHRSEGSEQLETFHDRIREALVEALEPEQTADLHSRIADALQQTRDPDPETVAVHLVGAQRSGEAVHFAETAAEQALEALAFERAARLFDAAVHSTPDREHWGELRRKQGEALARAGRGFEAAKAFLDAASSADPDDRALLEQKAGRQLLRSGRLEEGLEALRPQMEEFGVPIPRSRWGLYLKLAWWWTRARLSRLTYTERSAEDIPARQLRRVDACWAMAEVVGTADGILGAYYQARHLLLALKVGEPFRVGLAVGLHAAFYAGFSPQDTPYVQRLWKRAATFVERADSRFLDGRMDLLRAVSADYRGQWQESHDHYGRAEAILLEHGSDVVQEVPLIRFGKSTALMMMGQVSALAGTLPGLLEDARARGDLFQDVSLRVGCSAFVRLAHDDPDGALAEIHEALDRWPVKAFSYQHGFAMAMELQVLLYAGRFEDVRALLARTSRALKWAIMMRAPLIGNQIWDAIGRAALAEDLQRGGGGGRALRREVKQCVSKLARVRSAWATSTATVLDACLASAEGDLEGARIGLADAERQFSAMGMELHSAAARRALALGAARPDAEQAAREEEKMAALGVRNPAAMARLLVPVHW